MKTTKIFLLGMAGLSAILGLSCTKTFDEKIAQQNDFSNSSLAQVFIGTVNASRNYVYMDGKPVTGALLASGGLFPASGTYAFNVPAGLRSFLIKDTLSTSTQVPLSFAANLQVGKNYTIFTYDTITSPKQITVLSNMPVLKDTSCRIRFANFIYSPTAVPAIDVYSRVKATNVFTNVVTNTVTDFIPYFTRFTDTLDVRETGTTNLVARFIFTGGLSDRRYYTLAQRGSAPRGSYAGTRAVSSFLSY
jgi:hypothetical protein